MARYKMDDGIIVETENSTGSWKEATDWDGNNHISRATGSQWDHETLYRSRKGRYYIVIKSQWQGTLPSARWVTPVEAAAWLIHNDEEVPDDLQDAAGEATE